MRSNVALVQTVVPDYRVPVFRRLDELLGRELRIYAGETYFDPTVVTDPTIGDLRVTVRNRFVLGRRLLLQTGHWRATFSARAAVLELNPRILSNWGLLIARKLARRRTLVWGHAWPRSGRGSKSDRVRHLMRRLAADVIVYSESEADVLRRALPRRRIYAAPNALYGADYCPSPEFDAAMQPGFAYVGRLVPSKRPELLIRAYLAASPELPADTRLYVVGDGPEQAALRQLVGRQGSRPSACVEFLGHSTDRDLLSRVYRSSIASVSPGYVGLSLVQSLYHGVPMIIARDEPHSPEIEAAQEGFNSVFFDSGSVDALAAAMVSVARNAVEWNARRGQIASDCRSRYSADAMAQRMHDAVIGAAR